ncbi:hypothetical protein Tco_0824923, partial [Tanacetum coccineum]
NAIRVNAGDSIFNAARHYTYYARVEIQALVDKKKVIITETSVRSDLQLKDVEGTECLPIAIIFEQLTLMGLSQRVLDLEKTKTSQAVEITELKERVKKLEKKKGSRTHRLKRLYKVGRSARVVSSEDEGLGDQEDASKQGRKIDEIDHDAKNRMWLRRKLVLQVTTDSTTTTTVDELTLAQTLIEIKAAKPKVVTTTATTTTTAVTRPKARGVIVQDPSKFTTTTSPSQPSQLPQAKDKGKAKMVDPEKPLKNKDQIMFDKEVAQKLQAQLDAELEEEEKLARQREEDANIAEWDNVQAMMDADYELATRLHAEEQGELTIKEKSRLFVELMNKRKKHFTRIKAEEYKHNQLKTKSFEDIQMLFDKEIKRVNTFINMDAELVKGSETRTEGSSKRAGEELESENLKKQTLDENVEAEVDDDQEEAEMKKHMEIVLNDEVAIDAIPLATKPPIIVDWKTIKEENMGYFQIIRADGSSKSVEESTRTQSDNLEAIFFKWSTFCEISESAYLYAGRK